MNSFYEHHKDSIRWHYRCFDRILLNGLIQPFQQPERVVGFFNTYRQLYPVTRYTLRDIADQFQRWVQERAAKHRTRSAASAGSRSKRPPASLRSMTMVVPSTQPSLRSSSDKAFVTGAGAHELGQSIPIRATLGAGCVAAADAKTSSAIRIGTVAENRLIRSPCLRTGRYRDSEPERLGPETSRL